MSVTIPGGPGAPTSPFWPFKFVAGPDCSLAAPEKMFVRAEPLMIRGRLGQNREKQIYSPSREKKN